MLRHILSISLLILSSWHGSARAESLLDFMGKVKGPIIRSKNGSVVVAVAFPEITNVSEYTINSFTVEVWISKKPFNKKGLSKAPIRRIWYASKPALSSYESLEPQTFKSEEPLIIGLNDNSIGTYYPLLAGWGYIDGNKVPLFIQQGRKFKVTKYKRTKPKNKGYSVF